jgi:transcriptional regulator with XRE-family HTH domain
MLKPIMDKSISHPLSAGELIKSYRNEKGLSQLDLEVGIGAAFGSLTKIENGKINPSKETIYKIIDFLELSPAHALKLFNIDMSFFGRIIANMHKLASVKDLKEVMSIALNDVREQLGLAGGAFYLIEGGELHLKALSSAVSTSIVTKIVKEPFKLLRPSLEHHQENLLIQAVSKNEIVITDSLYEMLRPQMSKWLSDRAQKITFTAEIIGIPIVANGRVVALITYGSSLKNQFKFELDLLKAFAAEIGLALERLNQK